MKTIGGLIVGAAVLLAAAGAYAQGPGPATGGTVEAPMAQPQAPATINRSGPPLFWIGNLPVRLWAPVQPSYDQNANRNGAANPLWGAP